MDKALKAACELDLGFPFHRPETPAQRLRAIADWMEAGGKGWEVYVTGETAQALEQRIAELTGKPAAIWMPTGTMGQALAARLHCESRGNYRLALHPNSHLLLHEQGGARYVHGLDPVEIGEWAKVLTASDLPDNAGCAIVELGQRHNGGLLPRWGVLEALKARATELNLPLHMDGARLWSTRPHFDNRSYAEICEGFASVYVSLYKDIGAIGGAVLAGEEAFIEQMRTWRARLGGMFPMAWPNTADALRLLDEQVELMPELVARARMLGEAIDRLDGLSVTPSPVQTNLFHVEADASVDAIDAARDAVARDHSVWLFSRCWGLPQQERPAIEVTVGAKLYDMPPERVIEAFAGLARRLA